MPASRVTTAGWWVRQYAWNSSTGMPALRLKNDSTFTMGGLSSSASRRVDLPLEEPAEPSAVLRLQLRLHPILPRDDTPAVRAAAPARHLLVEVVGGRPVDRQLFPGADVPHRHQHDLALDGDIGIAAVVDVEHAAVALGLVHRCDEEIFRQLDLRRAEARLKRCPLLAREDVAALDRDDVAPRDVGPGEEPTAVNRAVAHLGPWRAIGQVGHGRPIGRRGTPSSMTCVESAVSGLGRKPRVSYSRAAAGFVVRRRRMSNRPRAASSTVSTSWRPTLSRRYAESTYSRRTRPTFG